MAYNKVITYESGKNFIESEVGLVQKTMMAQQTNAETVGDRKLIKAGSVFPTNATGAKGIVLDTVVQQFQSCVSNLPQQIDAVLQLVLTSGKPR